jgi:hypothetical protein
MTVLYYLLIRQKRADLDLVMDIPAMEGDLLFAVYLNRRAGALTNNVMLNYPFLSVAIEGCISRHYLSMTVSRAQSGLRVNIFSAN